jgi:hypothetical protein
VKLRKTTENSETWEKFKFDLHVWKMDQKMIMVFPHVLGRDSNPTREMPSKQEPKPANKNSFKIF